MVDLEPCSRIFRPFPAGSVRQIKLGMEELEALRLKDREGKDQTECAALMGLSRPTFQRVLYSARNKVAQALVEGNEICIKGGHYQMKNRKFLCLDCGEQWEVEPCTAGGKHGYEIPCPKCGSMKKSRVEADGSQTTCGGAHQHGHEHSHEKGHCSCGGHK
jgi:predicted DNA-binding protein (UPF0251 family)